MSEVYKIAIKVISSKGVCELEHKVGEEWILGRKTPDGICLQAFNAIYPIARVLMFGGSFPWQTDPDIAKGACPDPANPVVFELRRIRTK